ncbi:MAG TPA: TlpA disulfide reductase family protein [Saprospiraceae bacterium]
MKTLRHAFIFAVLCVSNFLELNAQYASTISGKIADFEKGNVILFEALTRDTMAQSKITDHHFTLHSKKGEISGQAIPAMMICLREDGKHSLAAPIAIENGDLKIDLNGTLANTYSGTNSQIRFSRFFSEIKEKDVLIASAPTEILQDSLKKVMATMVEDYYLETRNTNFRTFISLIVYDFINRKAVNNDDLDLIKEYCQTEANIDSLEQVICKALLETNTGWVGKQPIDFEGYKIDGTSIRLSDVIGSKPVIIDFWASWCGPCVKEMPELKALYAEGKIEIIGVSIDEQKAAWEKSLAKLELPWINIIDNRKKEIATKYNVIAVPAKFVISKEGIIAFHNPEDLRSALASLY